MGKHGSAIMTKLSRSTWGQKSCEQCQPPYDSICAPITGLLHDRNPKWTIICILGAAHGVCKGFGFDKWMADSMMYDSLFLLHTLMHDDQGGAYPDPARFWLNGWSQSTADASAPDLNNPMGPTLLGPRELKRSWLRWTALHYVYDAEWYQETL